MRVLDLARAIMFLSMAGSVISAWIGSVMIRRQIREAEDLAELHARLDELAEPLPDPEVDAITGALDVVVVPTTGPTPLIVGVHA
jgi:hypothetical protein